MKLQYRGINYDRGNNIEAVGTTVGKFRGRWWSNSHKKAAIAPSGLVYRGVAVR